MQNVLADPIRTVAGSPWSWKGFGNHRAIIRVEAPAKAVRVLIPWRRRDLHPEQIGVRIVRLDDGVEVTDILPVCLTRESGEMVFEAPKAGRYAVYFMPFEIEAKEPWRPFVRYRATQARSQISDFRSQVPQAVVEEIQARTEMDRFDPMELIAGPDEIADMVASVGDRPFFLFAEDRRNPIRMHDDLPIHWVRRGPSCTFAGEARPSEYYVFQIGVWARQLLRNVKVEWDCDGLDSTGRVANPLAAASPGAQGTARPTHSDSRPTLTCFNLAGTDWLGRSFTKRIDVEAGQVQALWFGVDLPATVSGVYRTAISISAEGVPAQQVEIELTVAGEPLADRGDGELWRHARLRWLNSTIGLDDDLPAGWPALEIQGRSISCLGRTVQFGALGLPEQISSRFAPSVDRLQETPVEILARPITLSVQTSEGEVVWSGNDPPGRAASPLAAVSCSRRATDCAPYPEGSARGGSGGSALPGRAPHMRCVSPLACEIDAGASADALHLTTHTRMEYDGHLDCRLTLTVTAACELTDLALEIPLRREVAEYMMGLGRRGGYRPASWDYRWDLDRANHYTWIGTVNAGLHLKLKHDEDVWELSRLHGCGFPRGWHNEGKGGVELREVGSGEVLLRAFCGPRTLAAGETLSLRFSLIVTPLKLLDLEAHWRQRYHHIVPGALEPDPVEARRVGATVVNQHQGGRLNPYINYPFQTPQTLKAATAAAHALGLKFKLYYTLRELTHMTQELWAFRSLNGEIFAERGRTELADQFTDKAAGPKPPPVRHGGPWLREHLVDRYVPAWHEWLPNGELDQAIATTGLSRLHNYYLEGLSWLIREMGIDGLYLDGIGYDREVMKRVRRVMDRARPGCLIDFHSGNNFHPDYGMGNPLALYMELLPSIDSLWIGEGFDYESSEPDYFMTEVCGIPFGLANDMLQDGGNPWRGMVYGMTCRFGWMQGGDPRHLWAFWDAFGMAESRMIGYWHPECPVKTDHPQVLATAYVRPDGAMLIALASWAREPVKVRVTVDGAPQSFVAPALRGFQEAAEFGRGDTIPVEPRRGWLLVLHSGRAASPFAAGIRDKTAVKGLTALPREQQRAARSVSSAEIVAGLQLLSDGMECGRVRVGLSGELLTVDATVHDVELFRHPTRHDKGSYVELFVAAGAADAPLQLVFLPAASGMPAAVQVYRGGQPQTAPAILEWAVQLEADGYRLKVSAPLFALGLAPDASQVHFDCAVGATEPVPNWIRTRAQLAGARYPFASSEALLSIAILGRKSEHEN